MINFVYKNNNSERTLKSQTLNELLILKSSILSSRMVKIVGKF